MVAVSTLTFDVRNINKFFPVFYKILHEEGFRDLNELILTHAVQFLNESINEDFQDVIKVTNYGIEKKILVNSEMKTSVLLDAVPLRGKNSFHITYEVSIFSDKKDKNTKTMELINDILISRIKINSEITEGSLKEARLSNLLDKLKETHRSRLIAKVTDDMINIFMDKSAREALKNIANIPYKIIPRQIISKTIEWDKLVKVQIFKESYIANCKKCPETYPVYITSFESKKAVVKNLEDKVMLCPSCGKELTTKNATIESVYSFTDIGQECAKGLWLEAYIRSLLIKEGISSNKMLSFS